MRLALAIVAVLAVGAIAVVLRRSPGLKRVEALKGPIGSLEGDRQVLAQLRKADADLSKPTEVNYYLYFAERQAADSAAAHVGPGPLRAMVQRAADNSAWLCLVTGTMVPSEESIRSYTTRLLDVAHRYHGEYDGWEAAVTK